MKAMNSAGEKEWRLELVPFFLYLLRFCRMNRRRKAVAAATALQDVFMVGAENRRMTQALSHQHSGFCLLLAAFCLHLVTATRG
jgi:hypothetical protein